MTLSRLSPPWPPLQSAQFSGLLSLLHLASEVSPLHIGQKILLKYKIDCVSSLLKPPGDLRPTKNPGSLWGPIRGT